LISVARDYSARFEYWNREIFDALSFGEPGILRLRAHPLIFTNMEVLLSVENEFYVLLFEFAYILAGFHP
jgi:hypothetical protein